MSAYTQPCGCQVVVTLAHQIEPPQYRIVYCPTHAAAVELLAALRVRVEHADHCQGHRDCHNYDVEGFAQGRTLIERLDG